METVEEPLRELRRPGQKIKETAGTSFLGRATTDERVVSGELVPVRIRRGENALMDALFNFILKTQTEEGLDWSQRDVNVTVLRRGEGR
ncbi:MAG: hypothetical protein ABSH29_08465 [Acidimicrobiales bacterium]